MSELKGQGVIFAVTSQQVVGTNDGGSHCVGLVLGSLKNGGREPVSLRLFNIMKNTDHSILPSSFKNTDSYRIH